MAIKGNCSAPGGGGGGGEDYKLKYILSLDKIGGISEKKINKFILLFARFALSLQLIIF